VERLLLSGHQASDYLGIDPSTFRALAKENKLEPVSTGRRKFWRRAELERLAGLMPAKENV